MLLKSFFILCLSIPVSFITGQEVVKIGLLIQDKNSLAARQGAGLAISMANKNGGLNGVPFRMIVKSMEGPWGTGSKQAVSLIWDDEVWALVGSHDGRNAHLVEQASAKSIVPFVSVWSSDPTLSQAFIPWFFNCVPNDDQQAQALIENIFVKRKYTNVAVVTDNSYDSNQAFKSFMKYCRIRKTEPAAYNYDEYQNETDRLIREIERKNIGCLVLFCRPEASLRLVKELKSKHIDLPLYASLLILNENRLGEKDLVFLQNTVKLATGSWSTSKMHDFRKDYVNAYGINPGIMAAYAYDGMNSLIEAIRIAKSPDCNKIEEALSNLQYNGVTGKIQFGDLGVRENACVIF